MVAPCLLPYFPSMVQIQAVTASPHSAAGSPTGSVPTHVYVSSFEHTAWLPGTHTRLLSSSRPSCPSSSLLPSLLPYLSPADAPAEMPNQATGAFPRDVSRTQRQLRAPKGRAPYVPAESLLPEPRQHRALRQGFQVAS